MTEVLVKEVNSWHTPATEYTVAQAGNFRLCRSTCKPGHHHHQEIDGARCTKVTAPIVLTVLQEQRRGRWCDWMADDPFDYWAMQKYAAVAHGKVLTSGLGLGLVTHELVKNDKVENVTIIERSPEVIELTAKYLPKGKVTLIQGDFWEYVKQDTTQWDMIITDIWVTHNRREHQRVLITEVIPARKYLEEKYPGTVLVFHGFWQVSDILV